jgi:V8-like Glu-specific endopeptidase
VEDEMIGVSILPFSTGMSASGKGGKSLIRINNDLSVLKVKNYGNTFNLCEYEPFRQQPIASCRLCTGFLVKEDVIATAGHCADEKNVTELRIVFGFKMLGLSTPVTWIPNENIYNGVKIIHRVYDPKGSGADWELIKLDRKVVGQSVVKLSDQAFYRDQPVYILGHPCWLPLKYTSGAQVRGITEDCFSADLNVYCGNSGSPVFDCNTHEVIGIVVRGDSQDFRWTGKGWLSVIYPNPVIRSQKPQCTRVSEFKNQVI